MSDPEQASEPETPGKTAPSPTSGQASAEPSPAAPRGSSTLPLVIALLALGLSIGLAVAAWFTWNQMQQIQGSQSGIGPQVEERLQPVRASIEAATTRQQNDRREIDKQFRELDRQLMQLRSDIEKLGSRQKDADHRVEVLAALIGRSESGWSLAEVEYLLRVANQKLQLQRDIATAEVALQSADTRLHELADPRYLPVRKQIARELEALQSLPKVDVDGVAATLNAWVERIGELPVEGASYEPPQAAPAPTGETPTTAKNWRDLVDMVEGSLEEVFRIREHDAPVRPMLAPKREYFLRENLRLQLAAARLALLRDDAVQYRTSLETAQGWVKAYFTADDPEVQQLAKKLGELVALDVHPALPDISASLHLLQQQVRASEQQAVAPAAGDDNP